MKLYGIGNALFYYREQKGLTQAQVCAGICPEMTLSRIETGEREFDSMISETLLERVGKNVNRFEFVLNNGDYILYELRVKIQQYVKAGDLKEAKELISKYTEIMPQNSVLHKQFVMFNEAVISEKEGGERERFIPLFHEAINLTRPDFLARTSQMILYSKVEIDIIFHLLPYEEYTEEMLKPVIRFIQEMYDGEKQEILISLYLFLIQRYEENKMFYDVIRISEQAISLLQRERSLLYLPELFFHFIKAKYQLSKLLQNWEKEKAELLELCNETYYAAMVVDDIDMMERIKLFCEEKLECQITM